MGLCPRLCLSTRCGHHLAVPCPYGGCPWPRTLGSPPGGLQYSADAAPLSLSKPPAPTCPPLLSSSVYRHPLSARTCVASPPAFISLPTLHHAGPQRVAAAWLHSRSCFLLCSVHLQLAATCRHPQEEHADAGTCIAVTASARPASRGRQRLSEVLQPALGSTGQQHPPCFPPPVLSAARPLHEWL